MDSSGVGTWILVLSEQADSDYKATDYYSPKYEAGGLWNGPALDIVGS